MSFYYFSLSFFVYGFLGWCTEVIFAAIREKRFVNRGFLNGPICPIYGVGVGLVTALLERWQSNLVILYLVSVILVSGLELITGFILEQLFHNRWWDYSQKPLNIKGYICLPFSLVWGVACVFVVKVFHPLLDKVMNYLPVTVGIVLLVILGVVMFADLYVTSAGILTVYRRLASMERIAVELKGLSGSIGENLFRGVAEAMELQAGVKEKLVQTGENTGIRERMEKLRREYDSLASKRTVIYERLAHAFPRMRLKRYQSAWDELRKRWKRK